MAGGPTSGSRLKPFLERHPQARYWVERGLHPKAARELVKAGILAVEDLAERNREELARIPGVGEGSLAALERLRGAPFVSAAAYWLERGMQPQVAHALSRAGIDSIEKVETMTREELLFRAGLSAGCLRACEAVLGRPLDSPAREWRRRGLWAPAAHRLAAAGIRTVEDLAALSGPALETIGLPPAEVAICRGLVRRYRKAGS